MENFEFDVNAILKEGFEDKIKEYGSYCQAIGIQSTRNTIAQAALERIHDIKDLERWLREVIKENPEIKD